MNSERITQNRVVKLFTNTLGYIPLYGGNLQDRLVNTNIEEAPLATFLRDKQGYSDALITKAVAKLRSEATNHQRGLYFNNMVVYNLLHYGVDVKEGKGKHTDTVWLIDWKNPLNNDFYIAEEVTIKGNREKRPDVVLYVNGIALATIELKKSSKSIGEGIRQNRTNRETEFIQDFFSTIQFCFAGSDSEGLRYGTIETGSKYYLQWKEDEATYEPELLDKYLKKICGKERFLEIIHDFVLFDGGKKKLPRYHQYFGIKEAQKRIAKKGERNHLAHAGLGQEHHDGAAHQMDTGHQSQRAHRHHYRPHRTRYPDQTRIFRSWRKNAGARHQRQRPDAKA